MYDNYSVLMSVYKYEKPENLKVALDSIVNQTYKSNEIILVQDGPLTDELNLVIEDYEKIIKVLKLPVNVGLGNALNIGVEACSNELIMRMDSDDYSTPQRAEKMMNIFCTYNQIDVLGTSVKEFNKSIDKTTSLKTVLENHEDIVKRLKYRNPMNHPSVMYKKSSVLNVGSYKEIKYNEDYFLWVRLAIDGARFMNLSEPLVYMRVDDKSFERRHGYGYYKNQKILFKYMKNNSFINIPEYFFNLLNRLITKVFLPKSIMQKFYAIFLRKKE